MSFEIRLLHDGLGLLCDPLDPTTLSEWGPSWADDLRPLRDKHTFNLDSQGALDVLVGSDATVHPVWICGRCHSTMDVAWELVKGKALSSWDGVLAVEQGAGRGQLRRPWLSVSGNLHVSFYLPCPPSPWDGLLSLVIGYVLCTALGELGADLRIKWPNDLYQSGRKVGGILVEQRGQDVVVGLGLNLIQAPLDCEMRKDAAARAGILKFKALELSPLRTWLALVNQSKSAYMALLENNSPSAFLSLVSRRLLWLGRMVYHQDGNQWSRARLVGLHRDGGLILERDGSTDIVYSGSILFEQP